MRAVLLLAGLVLVWHQAQASLCPPAPRNTLTGHVRTPHEMECEPCEQLFAPDSSFMQNCGDFLPGFILNKLSTSCENIDVDQMDDFLQNLHILCDYRGFGPFDDPSDEECECDVCELLFDPNSDFMTRCAFDFSATAMDALRYKCDIADCSSYGLIYLEKYLKWYCTDLGRNFRFPSCECDECLMFFADGSPFMENCGAGLDDDTLDQLYETCSLCMDDVDALFTFFQTVQNLCTGRGFDAFPLPVCDCSDFCWHLFDTTRPFYQNCFSQLPFSRRLELFKECRSIHMDAALSQQFIDDLEAECAADVNVTVEVPTECIICTHGQIDLILVVDNSGSINPNGGVVKDFLEEIIDSFTISNANTRVGIIWFASSPVEVNDLDKDNNKPAVFAAIASIPSPGGGTVTSSGIAAMTTMFNDNNIGNKQIGIVLTDGKGDLSPPLDPTVAAIPASVEMFAVGIGSFNLDELNNIASDPSHVITANNFIDLPGKIEQLREELCS